MTQSNSESRHALRKLAAQAGSISPKAARPVNQEKSSGRVIVGLIVIGLTVSLGWLFCSDGLERPAVKADTAQGPAGGKQGTTASSIGSSAWTSAQGEKNAATSASIPTTRNISPSASTSAKASRDDNLEKRVGPVEALARSGDPGAVQAVLDALRDEDWRVRSRVIDAAVNAYVPIPEAALIESAQSDSSPDVRFVALAGIAARIDPAIPQVDAVDPNTARAIGRQALNDANESVRWQAQQILETLDARQQPTASNDPLQMEVLL